MEDKGGTELPADVGGEGSERDGLWGATAKEHLALETGDSHGVTLLVCCLEWRRCLILVVILFFSFGGGFYPCSFWFQRIQYCKSKRRAKFFRWAHCGVKTVSVDPRLNTTNTSHDPQPSIHNPQPPPQQQHQQQQEE